MALKTVKSRRRAWNNGSAIDFYAVIQAKNIEKKEMVPHPQIVQIVLQSFYNHVSLKRLSCLECLHVFLPPGGCTMTLHRFDTRGVNAENTNVPSTKVVFNHARSLAQAWHED